MDSIGEQLRKARHSRKLSLDDVHESTKIRKYYLQCLEDGEYDKLPDRFCLVSFQRQYATLVGLDPIAAVDAIDGEGPSLEPIPPAEDPVTPALPPSYFLGRAVSSIADEGRKNLGAIATVIVAIALILAGSYWWYSLDRSGHDQPAPDEPVSGVAVPVPPAGDASVESRREDSASGSALQSGDLGAGLPSATPSIDGPLNNDSMQIEVRASGLLWVRSVADGTNERQATLRAGESQIVEADEFVHFSLGNAGVATLIVDGEVQDGLGADGQVRHLRITRDGLSFLSSGAF